MRKIAWISLLLFIALWYIYGKYSLGGPEDNFKFSDRDKSMVFPTPVSVKLDSLEPTITASPEPEKPTIQYISASDTSVIKF